ALLLPGVTFAPQRAAVVIPGALPAPVPQAAEPATAPAPLPPTTQPRAVSTIPYEKDSHTRFVTVDTVAAIRAEGHYTVLYVGAQKLFCPWSITEAEARVPQADFVRTHRSYLVNRNHVSGFERKKDTGVCFFDSVPALGKVPVSRARLPEVRAVLGL
uniref:LytTR family DNA-binding domain-containing protein n=1 Tax=Pararhodobacter sp. TaxID=2127056 RepID=UPI002FDE4113